MYTSAALLDIHRRMHRNMAVLLEHCALLNSEQFQQELSGFGIPSVHRQLFHTLATEWFWMSVLRGAEPPTDERAKYNAPELLEQYRQHVAQLTADYLRGASEAELDTRRRMEVDPGEFDDLVPAHVFMRVVTHQYHHQGQVLAMCRTLGHPRSDELPVDFPID
jgi:uncharacterized damage-inducible protein DinB